jgi:uncharacterized membrane protein
MDARAQTTPDERTALRLVTDGKDDDINVGTKERIASTVGGVLLGLYGLTRRDRLGLAAGVIGLSLIKRGATGHCATYSWLGLTTEGDRLHVEDPSVDPESALVARHSVTVNRSPTACYEMWRDFTVLPRFMDYLERVDVIDDTRSRWYAKGPAGVTIEWDAEIVRDVQNERISWRSVDPADVPNRGTVEFIERAAGAATELRVALEWDPPGGKVAKAVAAVFRRDPDRELRNSLERFREVMERLQPADTPGASD